MIEQASAIRLNEAIGEIVMVRGTIVGSRGVEIGIGKLADFPMMLRKKDTGAYSVVGDHIDIYEYRQLILPTNEDAVNALVKHDQTPRSKLGHLWRSEVSFHKSNTEISLFE